MNVEEIMQDATLVEFIRKFVLNPNFPAVKDAFIAHTPEKADSDTTVGILFGKGVGTRYVFNKMEEIAKTKPTAAKQQRGTGKDPDLET